MHHCPPKPTGGFNQRTTMEPDGHRSHSPVGRTCFQRRGTRTADGFLPETNQSVPPEVPTGALTESLWHPPPSALKSFSRIIYLWGANEGELLRQPPAKSSWMAPKVTPKSKKFQEAPPPPPPLETSGDCGRHINETPEAPNRFWGYGGGGGGFRRLVLGGTLARRARAGHLL